MRDLKFRAWDRGKKKMYRGDMATLKGIDMIKLKECPFCKGKAEQLSLGEMPGREYRVYAVSCLNCCVSTARYPTKKESEIMWNMRGGR